MAARRIVRRLRKLLFGDLHAIQSTVSNRESLVYLVLGSMSCMSCMCLHRVFLRRMRAYLHGTVHIYHISL